MLSLHQDYKPELADTENGGVVAIVDSIQTQVLRLLIEFKKCCAVQSVLNNWSVLFQTRFHFAKDSITSVWIFE